MSFGIRTLSSSGVVQLDTSVASLRLHSVWTIPSLASQQMYTVTIPGFSVANGWRTFPDGPIVIFAAILPYEGYLTIQNKHHASTIGPSTLLVLKT
jgi:hypothetical protein